MKILAITLFSLLLAIPTAFANDKETIQTSPLQFDFIRAIQNNDLDGAKRYLKKGADVHFEQPGVYHPHPHITFIDRGQTPLLWAAGEGHIKMLKFLVENGVDINEANSSGKTALMAALDSRSLYGEKQLEVLRWLINNGADVNARSKGWKDDHPGESLWLYMDKYSDPSKIGKLLIESGIIMDSDSDAFNHDLGMLYWNNLEALKFLIDSGAKITPKFFIYNSIKTNLMRGNAKEFLFSMRNPNEKNKESGSTLLIYFAQVDNGDAFNRLLDNPNILIDKANNKGLTALMMAAYFNKTKNLEKLLKKGANVNLTNNNKNSALALAGFGGSNEAIDILLEHKDINREDLVVALYGAAMFDHQETVNKLLDTGVIPTQAIIDKVKNQEMKQLLEKHMQQ